MEFNLKYIPTQIPNTKTLAQCIECFFLIYFSISYQNLNNPLFPPSS